MIEGLALEPFERQLAGVLCDAAGEASPALRLAVAGVARSVSEGHACLDLAALRARLDPEGVTEGRWPDATELKQALETSALVRGEDAPLVARGERLYFARHAEAEARIAGALCSLAGGREAVPAEVRAAASAAAFPGGEADPVQREAVLRALGSRLTVIAGGPGTGKTSTVVRVLLGLVAEAAASDRDAPTIALAAPTGKAAARMGEAISRALSREDFPGELVQAIPREAATLHRLLGVRDAVGGFSPRPIDAEVIVVDEVSMVDLSLMDALLGACRADARVVLLGDPQQLASVSAGSVLRDIVTAAGRGGPLEESLVALSKSYRYREGSGLDRLAKAIAAGDAEAALGVLRDPAVVDVTLAPWPDRGALPEPLVAAARHVFARTLDEPPSEGLLALGAHRTLTAHRHGPRGLERVGARIETALGVGARATHYRGRPLLVTRNAPGLGLFNGDTGLVMRDEAGLAAAFEGPDGQPRRLALARLPPHETVFAMSVHKSQGSEMSEVDIVLPEGRSPLATREWLYTALTRARRAARLYGTEEDVRAAIARTTSRDGGLAEALGAG